MLVVWQHEYLVSGPPAHQSIFQATFFTTGAALALVAWDALLSLDDEVDLIWSKSGQTCFKWIYLFSRWFGLVNQIGIQIWYSLIAKYSPIPVSTCTAFYVLEGITFQVLQMCLNAILILQIWAVYHQHRPYIAAAVVLVFLEFVMAIVTDAIAIPSATVDGTCILLYTPKITSAMGIAMMVSQAILLCLTYRGKLLMQPVARRSKILNVVVRDGIFAFTAVIGILSISLIYLRYNQVIVNVLFPWMPVIPSILTPRMVLNMQMAVEPAESAPEFTTELDIMQTSEIL